MLIFDGADFTGKTTMVLYATRYLQEQHGAAHMPMHLTRPPETFDYYRGYLDKISVETVWDRFHLSNLAYRSHDDHVSSMTPLKYELVDAALRQAGGFVVAVWAERDVIRERCAARGNDTMYDLEHILRVNSTFHDIAENRRVTMRGAHYRPIIDADIHVDRNEFDLTELNPLLDAYYDRLQSIAELLSGE